MALTPTLQYSRKQDVIKSVPDIGHLRTADIADHVLVLMLKGIYKQWKQPVCFTFSSGPVKSITLKTLIQEVIQATQETGLKVIATVCDQGAANSAAINILIKTRKEAYVEAGIQDEYFGFLVNNYEIIPLYDVPHMFKGVRNNLLSKNLHFNYKGKDRIVVCLGRF